MAAISPYLNRSVDKIGVNRLLSLSLSLGQYGEASGPVHTYPDTFESVYFSFRIHLSSTRIRWIRPANPVILNPLSRVATFESHFFSDTYGRLNPDTFESDDVGRSGPVSTVVSTTWLKNNMAANQHAFAVLVGLRVLGKTTNLYSRLSLKFYILCTLKVGVRPRHRSK